jgi:hypothetical protein
VVASTEVEGGKGSKWKMKGRYVRNQMLSDAKRFRLKQRAYQVEIAMGQVIHAGTRGEEAGRDRGREEAS